MQLKTNKLNFQLPQVDWKETPKPIVTCYDKVCANSCTSFTFAETKLSVNFLN